MITVALFYQFKIKLVCVLFRFKKNMCMSSKCHKMNSRVTIILIMTKYKWESEDLEIHNYIQECHMNKER